MPLKGNYNYQNIARKKLKEGRLFTVNARWEIAADAEEGLLIDTNGVVPELVSLVMYSQDQDCLITIKEEPDSYDDLADEIKLIDNNRKTKNESTFKAKLVENISGGTNLGPNFFVDVESANPPIRAIIGGYAAEIKPLILANETEYIIAVENQSADNPTMVNLSVELFE